MRTILALVLVAALAPSREERLNVVILLADDLGWGDLGFAGHPKFKTPHLDRMAREGARLTNFYVPVPFCAPSRAALLTGRSPLRNGLTRNPVPKEDPGGDGNGDALGLAVEEVTLADRFRSAGYRTALIGKWHLGHQPPYWPTRRGFDEYFGIPYSNDMHPVKLFEGEREVEYPLVQSTLTKRYTERALRFIEENRDRPFFLVLAPAAPHKPLAASEEFYGKSGAGLYGDVIAELDAGVGLLLEKLRALRLDGRTLVWFTSDNGPWYGGSTGGLRGMKGLFFEGGLRVPLLAWWPGRIPPGHVRHEPAVIMDLFTTSLRAAGAAPPADRRIDGRDILPLLTSDAPSPHEAIFGIGGQGVATVRSGKWKFHVGIARGARDRERVWLPDEKWVDPRAPDGIRILAPPEQAHPSQYPGARGTPLAGPALFDLEADPAEQNNVLAEHPDVAARLRALADRFEQDVRRERLGR
jgi:uncharacterized sulfatase